VGKDLIWIGEVGWLQYRTVFFLEEEHARKWIAVIGKSDFISNFFNFFSF